MKTLRRQDLRTNELAQRLDHFSVYAKQHGTRLAISVGAVCAVAVAVFGYANYRSGKISNGWSTLRTSTKTDPADIIRECRDVAEARIEPGLTTQAWLKVGTKALEQLQPGAVTSAAGGMDFAQIAKEAFNHVLQDAPERDLTARGQALLNLGTLAENAGDSNAAQFYKQIVDDKRFEHFPFKTEAEDRLKRLPEILMPVKFATAPPPPLLGPELPDNIPVTPTPPAAKTTPPATTQPSKAAPAAAAPGSPPAGTAPPATATPGSPPASTTTPNAAGTSPPASPSGSTHAPGAGSSTTPTPTPAPASPESSTRAPASATPSTPVPTTPEPATPGTATPSPSSPAPSGDAPKPPATPGSAAP